MSTENVVINETLGTPERHPARYIGLDELAGFPVPEGGSLTGEYWEQEGTFLFQPTDSGKVFVVSDEDITRISTLSAV